MVYLAYWIGSHLFGPRYLYEGLYSLTLLSAAGAAFLAGWPVRPEDTWRRYEGWSRARPLLVTGALALLVSMNLLFYTPLRVGGMHGLYGISRLRLEPFLTAEAQELTPALVIVHPDHWTEYGALLELQDPFLDTPFIFVYARGLGRDMIPGRPDFPSAGLFITTQTSRISSISALDRADKLGLTQFGRSWGKCGQDARAIAVRARTSVAKTRLRRISSVSWC